MPRLGWTITFEGRSWSESDLTLADCVRALEICGGSWHELHPLTGPNQMIALLGLFLHKDGEDLNEALLRVARLRLVDAVAMISAGDPGVDPGEDPDGAD